MDVMVLKHHLKSVQSLNQLTDSELSPDERDQEYAMLLGTELDDGQRDRELQAHTDRIKMLEEELQKARSEAYQAGFKEGQHMAKTEAGKQFTVMSKEFSENIHAIHDGFTDTIKQLSESLLKLALGTSEKLIQRELSIDNNAQEILLAQIQNVLNATANQTRAIIQVNSSQLEWITSSSVLQSLNVPQKENLRFISNPQLQPGECKLETEDYLIDGTIKTQLDNLEKVLRESDAADT